MNYAVGIIAALASTAKAINCSDSPLRFNLNGDKQKCDWEGVACSGAFDSDKFASHCKGTCDVAHCCVDSLMKFKTPNDGYKDCNWVGKKEERCLDLDMADTCPVACKLCTLPTIQNLESNIDRLNEKNNDLDGEIDNLTVMNNYLTVDIDSLTVQNYNLIADIDTLKVKNQNLESDIDRLNEKNNDLDGEIDTLTADIDTLNVQNYHLTANIDNLKVKNLDLTAEIEILKASQASFCNDLPDRVYINGAGCFQFVYRDNKLMLIVRNKHSASWEAHKGIAIACGGNLASILDEEENQKIAVPGGFIGAVQTQPCNLEPAGCWSWSDGSEFAYSNWLTNQPSNNYYTENCVHTGPYDVNVEGGWNDMVCDGPTNPAVYLLPTDFNSDSNCDIIL